jgi:hypothetical protein
VSAVLFHPVFGFLPLSLTPSPLRCVTAQNDAPVVLNGTASDISFTLVVSGVEMPQMNCQARSGALPSACLAEQGAVTYDNSDSVIVTYSPVTGVEGATSMELYACFSDIDAIGRPWRAPGSTYQVSGTAARRYHIYSIVICILIYRLLFVGFLSTLCL